MRMDQKVILFGIIALFAAAFAFGGCADEPIGQPCTFSWPVQESGATDCSQFPTCAPLQDTAHNPGQTPANDACPVDCIQLPSLECTNLICVATQVENDPTKMNGQCAADVTRDECMAEQPFGCMGYCTKECLSDASCPKGYKCSPMAPFGENLRCDDETLWGDGGGDPTKKCTDSCLAAGATIPGTTDVCPSSVEGTPNYDYAVCDVKQYSQCCACMCYRFCPLLTKKFCRKVNFDEEMFENGTTTATDCQQT